MKYRSRGMRRRGNSNSWELRLLHKDPVSGKDVTTYHTVEGKTQRQAERARDELIMKLETQGFSFDSDITIHDFLGKFMDYKADSKTIEPSTIRDYRHNIKQICEYIGGEQLCDLNVPMVNAWMAKMSNEGYAPKTVNKCFRLLKQAVNFAVAQDLLTKNPCNFCKPPKRVKTPINTLNRKERSRMLEIAREAQPQPLGIAIEIALTTGMRRGEVCALRWSDFDEEKKTISVNRAMGNGAGGFYEKAPKTESSKRTIPLTHITWLTLKQCKDSSDWMLKRLGCTKADPYILGTQEAASRPYNPDLLTKEFTAFCKMNNFSCSFHDLRHTFATYTIGAGVDVRTVSSYLGHASVTMTLEVYADVDPEAKKAAVSKIEAAFDDTRSKMLYGGKDDLQRFMMDELINPDMTATVMSKLATQQIPFSADELKAMLAVVEGGNNALDYKRN